MKSKQPETTEMATTGGGRQRRTSMHRRLPRSFSLDERVLAELDRRTQGENLSRTVENLLCLAMGVTHPEARAAVVIAASAVTPLEPPAAE